MTVERLCSSADLGDNQSLRVDFSGDQHGHGICLVRKGGTVYGYFNRCPHQSMAMDWLPGQFLDTEAAHIVCAMHGAHFRISDGLSVSGPCQGQALQAVTLEERDGQIVLLKNAKD